jgi:hypothetical protein
MCTKAARRVEMHGACRMSKPELTVTLSAMPRPLTGRGPVKHRALCIGVQMWMYECMSM